MELLLKSLSLFLVSVAFLPISVNCFVNPRPIIGIVAMDVPAGSSDLEHGTSYMYASYVKFVEMAGARVVPIMIEESKPYYTDILGKINGVLFTGGGASLKNSSFACTGKIIYDLAKEFNKRGDIFPIWATCLGFELLNQLAVDKNVRTGCHGQDLALPINLVPGFETSRMFQGAGSDLPNIMKTGKTSVYYQSYCFTPEIYKESGLDKIFRVLSYARDSDGLTFVNIVEANEYPFYGTSFHAEKVIFEWVLKEERTEEGKKKSYLNIPHNENAVKTTQYLANFFVSEARKSEHKFPNKESEDEVLIYKYKPFFTGKNGSIAVQKYFFKERKSSFEKMTCPERSSSYVGE